MARRLAAALVLVGTLGCDLGTGPDVRYVNRRPMEPVPALYAEWHTRVLDCLGRHTDYVVQDDFEAVRWFVADSIAYDGRSVWGLADLRGSITIRWDHVADAPLVRHEMEHEIRNVGEEAHLRSGHLLCEHDAIS